MSIEQIPLLFITDSICLVIPFYVVDGRGNSRQERNNRYAFQSRWFIVSIAAKFLFSGLKKVEILH